jgi:hypothetical protein
MAHAALRIDAGVVHRGRQRHRPGQQGLDLVGAVAVGLELQSEAEHVLVGSAGMGGEALPRWLIFNIAMITGFVPIDGMAWVRPKGPQRGVRYCGKVPTAPTAAHPVRPRLRRTWRSAR